MQKQNRMITNNWDLYDTRNVVYRPIGLRPDELKRGYDWAYRTFYRWSSIFKASSAHTTAKHSLKHFFYSAGWKKFERAWDFVIHVKQLSQMRPILEAVLAPVGKGTAPENAKGDHQNHDLKELQTATS
jgi:hypothetical protein